MQITEHGLKQVFTYTLLFYSTMVVFILYYINIFVLKNKLLNKIGMYKKLNLIIDFDVPEGNHNNCGNNIVLFALENTAFKMTVVNCIDEDGILSSSSIRNFQKLKKYIENHFDCLLVTISHAFYSSCKFNIC